MKALYVPVEVEQAIQAMYTAVEPDLRKRAVEWLHTFAADGQAWEVSFSLISNSSSAEVRFFASNLVYSKIQKEWSQQSEPFKEELHAHILRILEGWVQGSSEQSTPVAIPQNAIQRLCLAFAAMAVLTPALVDSYIEKTKAMLTLAFDQAQGRTQSIGNSTAPAFNNSGVSLNVSNGNQVDHNGGGGQAASVEEAVTSVADRAFFVAAELLRVLPEEKEQVHPPDVSALLPDGIENSLRTSVPKVVELIQVMQMAASPSSALLCLHSWASLGISLVLLSQQSPTILEKMLEALGSTDIRAVEAASSAFTSVLGVLSPEMQLTGVAGDEEVAALQAISQRLVEICRPALKSAVEQEGDNRRALAICRAITTFAETHTALIVAGTSPQLTSLADLIFDCTRFPNHDVSGSTLDFWLSVQDIAVQERHATFRESCYEQLLKILVDQCCVRAGVGPDELPYELENYRKIAKDVFISIFFVLRSHFFNNLLATLGEATRTHNISAFEAVLFAASAVCPEATTFVKEKQSSGPESTPVRDAILQLLLQVSQSPMRIETAMVLSSAVQFHGALAKLLPSLYLYYQYTKPAEAAELLERSLSCCVEGLKQDSVCDEASTAFMKICVACAKELAKLPELLESIVVEVERVIQTGLDAEARVKVVQGLVRISSEMGDDLRDPFIASVMNPGVQRLKLSLSQGDIQLLVKSASAELKCLETYVGFADSQHLAGLMTEIWPICEQLYSNQALMKEDLVGEALFNFLATTFLASSDVLKDKVGMILTACSSQYQNTSSSFYLDCMKRSVEVYGRDVAVQPVLSDLLVAVSRQTFALYEKKETLQHPDIVEKFFQLVYVYFLFCPTVLFTSPEFFNIWKLAIMSITVQESAAHRASVLLLQKVLLKAKQLETPSANEAVMTQGLPLVKQALDGLTGDCPSAHFPRFSALVLQIFLYDAERSQQWMYTALREDQKVGSVLSEQESQKFVQRLAQQVNDAPLMEDLLATFAKVVRGELAVTSIQ